MMQKVLRYVQYAVSNVKVAKRLFIILVVLLSVQAFSQQDKKPNVLFIAIDDLNDWNGILNGNPQARTPNLEKLASRGLVFTNAHCAAPACGPSRAAIMSGIRPSTSGNDLSALMRNPGGSWDKTSLTTYMYKNYSIRSERYRYIVYSDGTEELYDHEKDKWEWDNLAGDPEYDHIIQEMRKGIPDHHEPSGIEYEVPRRRQITQ